MTSNLESSSLSSSSELSSSPSSMTSTFSSSYQTLNSHETIDPMSHITKSKNSSKSKHANPFHHEQQHSTTSSTSSVVDSFNQNNEGTGLNANNFNYLVQQQQQTAFYPTAASVAEQGFYQNFGYGYNNGQDYGIKQEFEGQSQHAPLVNYYNNCKSKSKFVIYGRDIIWWVKP